MSKQSYAEINQDHTFLRRFREKIIYSPKGCWEWKGKPGHQGYGTIGYKKKNLYAHRVSYLIHCGDIPDKHFICHKCDNRICVNPDHLFLGTAYDNNKDMVKKGRSAKGESHSQSKLSEKEVEVIRYLYSTNLFCQKEIADFIGVQRPCIQKIVNNERWRHVETNL